ncbi:MAG: di-heme oxidoredictase family protein [Pseudomonadota bacterium]
MGSIIGARSRGQGLLAALLLLTTTGTLAQEQGRLGDMADRFDQARLASSDLRTVRRAGLEIFATPFNFGDGYGDGPMDPSDPLSSGGRPTLGNNGTFLRINGLDGQSCVDCHALVSTSTVPPRFGVGGFGGINDVPILKPTVMDIIDVSEAGFAFTDGRIIVPPHLFGSGAVQLLAEEMTAELQRLRDLSLSQPGRVVPLRTHGVDFGSVIADGAGNIDLDGVTGVDRDLVVRPFGRKGEFATVRDFAANAMAFHFGMEPVELVGPDVDGDGDGVANELLVGEISALEIFLTTMERPAKKAQGNVREGARVFFEIGCAECHRPLLESKGRQLSYRLPDADTPHYTTNLTAPPAGFEPRGTGIAVRLYSDLKRHDMGPELAESFGEATNARNREFVTPRLWGVGDSAPYLHDGRALTLTEAIEWHGGEGEDARNAFVAARNGERAALVAFLKSLRLPQQPNLDVVR